MQEMLKLLKERNNFIILTHRSPDGDTLGSAAGLCSGLRRLGKTAYMGRNPETTPRYLPFVEAYLAPDDYAHDTVVTVDIASRDLIPECWKSWPVHGRIDHHPTPGCYADVCYADTTAAACGEIIVLLLQELGVAMDEEIARGLYLAITTDTGCFRFASTTARTHRLAALLMETGLASGEIDELVFSQKTRARIEVESAVLQGLEYFADGKVALAQVKLDDIARAQACEDDLENISALPRQILGVTIGLVIRQEETGGCKISVRTAAPYGANTICARLGGGGHARAGGCRLPDCRMEKAREILLEAVQACYPELYL